MNQITIKDETTTLICASRLVSRISCLFAHANHVGLKPNYENLEYCLPFSYSNKSKNQFVYVVDSY